MTAFDEEIKEISRRMGKLGFFVFEEFSTFAGSTKLCSVRTQDNNGKVLWGRAEHNKVNAYRELIYEARKDYAKTKGIEVSEGQLRARVQVPEGAKTVDRPRHAGEPTRQN